MASALSRPAAFARYLALCSAVSCGGAVDAETPRVESDSPPPAQAVDATVSPDTTTTDVDLGVDDTTIDETTSDETTSDETSSDVMDVGDAADGAPTCTPTGEYYPFPHLECADATCTLTDSSVPDAAGGGRCILGKENTYWELDCPPGWTCTWSGCAAPSTVCDRVPCGSIYCASDLTFNGGPVCGAPVFDTGVDHFCVYGVHPVAAGPLPPPDLPKPPSEP